MAIIFLLPFFYFTGCSDKGEVNSPNQMNFESPQFALVDYNDIDNAIEDCTIDSPMAINGVLVSYSFMNMGNDFVEGGPRLKGNPWLERFNFGKHLGLFFRRLNLSDEQKPVIKDLMLQYHETIKPLVKEFAEANKDIITQANTNRKAIVDGVKEGTLSRADAVVQIKTLNEATRDAIKNNPKTVEVKAKMCEARSKLLTGIEGILIGEQLVRWNVFSAKIPDPYK